MKDFLGNQLFVGDDVVFIYSGGSGHRLMVGEIEDIKSGMAYIKGMQYGCYASDDPKRESNWGRQVKVRSSSVLKYRVNIAERLQMEVPEELGDEFDTMKKAEPAGNILYLDYKI